MASPMWWLETTSLYMKFDLEKFSQQFQQNARFLTGKTEKEIFSRFYSKIDKGAIYVLLESFARDPIKCEQKADIARLEGNSYYAKSNFYQALKKYNESVILAPHNSKAMSLGFANRSAVLFQFKKYKECVQDVELCLKYGYPDDIKYKIYYRLAFCYIQLGLLDKAQSATDDLKIYLGKEYVADDIKETLLKQLSLLEDKFVNSEGIIQEISTTNSSCKTLPELKNGENKNFANASSAVRLLYNKIKGRHVIANEELNIGDALFVEKPFVALETYGQELMCYHCFSHTINPYPCENCSEKFCSLKCLEDSMKYHKFECIPKLGNFLRRTLITHMAARMLFAGAETKFKYESRISPRTVNRFGNKKNNYEYACSLLPHTKKLSQDELLLHATAVTMALMFLQEKTDFFECYFSEELKFKKKELIYTIGGLLFKHTLQCVFNLTVNKIPKQYCYEKYRDFQEDINTKSRLYFNFVGIGLYPSAAMMNHSCLPNVATYFIKDYIIVKATAKIAKGEEIFTTYYPDITGQMLSLDRLLYLKNNFRFDCECPACTFPMLPEAHHVALLCTKCKGRAVTQNNITRCTICKHEDDFSIYTPTIEQSIRLFDKYKRTTKIKYLEQCLEIRESVYYKYNYNIYIALLSLKQYYLQKNDICKFWEYAERIIELSEVFMGKYNIRYAIKIQTYLTQLLFFLDKLSTDTTNAITEKQLKSYQTKAHVRFLEVKHIFSFIYPEATHLYLRKLLKKVNENIDIILEKKLFIEDTTA